MNKQKFDKPNNSGPAQTNTGAPNFIPKDPQSGNQPGHFNTFAQSFTPMAPQVAQASTFVPSNNSFSQYKANEVPSFQPTNRQNMMPQPPQMLPPTHFQAPPTTNMQYNFSVPIQQHAPPAGMSFPAPPMPQVGFSHQMNNHQQQKPNMPPAMSTNVTAFVPSQEFKPTAPRPNISAPSFTPFTPSATAVPQPTAVSWTRPSGLINYNRFSVKNTKTTQYQPQIRVEATSFVPTKAPVAPFVPSAHVASFVPSPAAATFIPEPKAAPVKAAPVQAAPVKAAPVKAAPVKAAPAKVEPVKAPVKVEEPKKDKLTLKFEAMSEEPNVLTELATKFVVEKKNFSMDQMKAFIEACTAWKREENEPVGNIDFEVMKREEPNSKALRGLAKPQQNNRKQNPKHNPDQRKPGKWDDPKVKQPRHKSPDAGRFIQRREDDPLAAEIIAKAKSFIQNKKSGTDTHQVRLTLNLITMDNYEKMKGKLREQLFGEQLTFNEQIAGKAFNKEQQDELRKKLSKVTIEAEIETLVVQTIFRKAAAERIYCGFYATLCSDIVAMELGMKGYEAKRNNVKFCNFRSNLLTYCRDSFLKIFSLQEQQEEEKDLQTRLKYKETLFGNIDFIGELYRNYLLPEKVLFTIFDNLLGHDSQQLTEDTLEAALNLVNKVGPELQQRIAALKEKETKGAEVPSSKKQEEVFQRLEDLMNGNYAGMEASQRISLLIKNMMDDRKTGWKKNSGQTGLKSKTQIKKEEENKMREKDRMNAGEDRNRGPRQDQKPQQQSYQEKKNSFDNKKGGNNKNNKGGKGGRKDEGPQKQSRPLKDIKEDDIGKQMLAYFKEYVNDAEGVKKEEEERTEEDAEEKEKVPEKKFENDYKIVGELQSTTKNLESGRQTSFGDIIHCFIEKAFEKFGEKDLSKHLEPFLVTMQKSSLKIGMKEFTLGVSRFLQLIVNLAADQPFICKVFAQRVLIPLVDLNMIDFRQVKWQAPSEEEDEDFKEVEAHYKVMAHLIHKYQHKKEWLKEQCPELLSEENSLKHILEHSILISEIGKELGLTSEAAESLCAIMGLDKTREANY